ncbi:hypothetical protein [Reichenbachiella sp. MALMAid0571]|uniref:hypothetical protein n=1 Tax=Reichenbachiella sp. MALMAid0571 TaxID=3143939 RepID=UPI0032E03B93
MSKLGIIIIAFFCLRTDWLGEAEYLIDQTDERATLSNTIKLKEKGGQTAIMEYGLDDVEKLSVHYDYGNVMDMESNFYSKDGLIFSEFTVGQDVLIYKRELQPSEPYASLIESKIYFKSETYGLKKTRKINIHESDNIAELKLKLKDKEFKIDTLGSTDYQRMTDKYNRIKRKTQQE